MFEMRADTSSLLTNQPDGPLKLEFAAWVEKVEAAIVDIM